MTIDLGSVQGFVFDAVPVLLDAAVKGMGLLAAAGTLVLAMRKTSAAARQVVWVLALAAMLALPLVSAVLPGWQVLPGWAKIEMPAEQAATYSVDPAGSTENSPLSGSVGRGRTEMSPAPAHAVMQATATPHEYPNESPADVPPSAAVATGADSRKAPAPVDVAAGTVAGPAKSWRTLLVRMALAVWLAGTLACLLPLGLGRLSLRRLARGSQRIDGGSWAVLLKRAVQAVGLGRRVRLLQSDTEPMPMVWGVLRPKLLLPAEAEDWSAQRRWVVLLHELAHIKRHDCLAKMVAHVACAAYWFNPLCWIAFKLMQREAEAACDDLVLSADHASTGLADLRPSDYAQHLLEIASGLKSSNVTSGLVAYSSIAMARASKLEGRLRAILDDRRNRRALTRLGLLIAAVLIAGLAVPLAVLRATGPDKPVAAKPDEPATQPTPAQRAMDAAMDEAEAQGDYLKFAGRNWKVFPRDDRYPLPRLSKMSAFSSQPAAWYVAADRIKNNWPDAYWKLLKEAKGEAKYRLVMVGSHSVGYKDELAAIGPKASAVLLKWTRFDIRQKCPPLFDRAVQMLGHLGQRDTVAGLVDVLDEFHRNDWLKKGQESKWYSPCWVVRAINKITSHNYGGLGTDLGTMGGNELEGLNWSQILAEIHKDLPDLATQPAGAATRPAGIPHHNPTPSFKILRGSGDGPALAITSSRVSVSNDGLMVASDGPRYHLIDVATGNEIKCVNAPTDGYWCISPDGKMAASTRGIVVDAMTGRKVAQPGNGSLGAAAMGQFSSDGRTLALFTGEAVFIYDTKTWKRKQTLTGPKSHITDISAGTMSADGSTVVIRMGVRTDGSPPQWLSIATSVYDVASGRKLMSTPRGSRCPTLSRDGKLVAIENEVIDVASGRTLLRGAASMRCAAISPAGDVVAVMVSGDTDDTTVDKRRIEIWNVATGKLVSQLACSDDFLDSLQFSSDAKLLIGHSGYPFGRSYIWQVSSATPVAGDEAIGSRSAARDPAGAASSQPVARTSAGMLEFRIAPVRSASFGRKRLQWYDEILRQGDVGFWYKKTERFIGRMPDHSWLLAARSFGGSGSITALYDHETYMLVSDKPQERLVPGSGADQWRLLRVAVSEIDAKYTRTIDLELDQRGGELMAELTSRNLNKPLAVIVDGKVLSVPVIKATSKTHFKIAGVHKDEAQVIVPLLREGIQKSATQPAGVRFQFEPVDQALHQWRLRGSQAGGRYVLHGYCEVTDGEVIAHSGGGSKSEDTNQWKFAWRRDGNMLVMNRTPGGTLSPVWPEGAELRVTAKNDSVKLYPDRYTKLWQGDFIKGGRVLKSVYYLARLADDAGMDAGFLTQQDSVANSGWLTTEAAAAFGPAVEHRITPQDSDDQGLVFFDMETGKPLKPPFALKLKEPTNPVLVEMTPELRQWIKANGADILLRLEDKGWKLNTLWMQVDFVAQPTQWDSVTPQAAVDVFARKDARGLVRREFPAARVGMDYREFISSCDAFRTGDDTVGVMQLSATDNSPVVNIRYRKVLGTGKAATQPGRWTRTKEYPAAIVALAERQDRKKSATPWRFEGVAPQVLADGKGRYRVAWVKKDPLRDSYWYNWHEFDQIKPVASGLSNIPSSLKVPDITKAPGWDGPPAKAPAAHTLVKVVVETDDAVESPAVPNGASTQPAAGAAEIDLLIKQLGSEKVTERKEAHATLIRIGRPAEARLIAATKDAKLERAHRAKLALQEIQAARLQVKLTSVEQLWTPGDAPRVRLEVRNIGDQPMRLMPLKHRGKLLNVGFRVRMLGDPDAGRDCGSQAVPMGWAAPEPVEVRPGESLTVENQCRPSPNGAAGGKPWEVIAEYITPRGKAISASVPVRFRDLVEFRIAPRPAAMGKAELGSCMGWLKAGQVGFWWKGGRMAGMAGRMPRHAWLPVAGELTGTDQLVTGEYNGRKYVLVSDKPDQIMVLGKGKNPWYLAKVYAVKGGSGKPAVGFELDARGAELFAALTKANIRNALAIVINSEVISAPMLMSPMGKHGMITGRFSEQEVKDLVKVLKAGMAPAGIGLDTTSKMLAEKVGGTWKPSVTNLFHTDTKIIRGRVPGVGASKQLFSVFPFALGDPRRLRVFGANANAQIIGLDERLIVLKASPLEPRTDAAVASALGLKLINLTPAQVLRQMRASATQAATQPASTPIDPTAEWEAKVGQTITVKGHAYRDKTGVRFLRPKGDTYPYRIELERVLPNLRGGGKPLPVSVKGTLRLRKHTVSKEEVEQYKRDLAENRKQMQLSEPKVGQIIRQYYIPDAVVTVLPVATEAASQPAKASPLAGLKIRLVLADKRKEYRIGETVKFNVLAENTGKQAVEFSLTRYPPTSYSNTTEGGMVRLHKFSGYYGGETLDEKFVIKPGRSTLLDTEEYILMPPDWMGNTKGRPGVIGLKPQKYSVSYRLSPRYTGQVRREVLHSEPLVAIDVLPGNPERIRQLTAKYPSGREVAEKFALEFLAAVRKGDAETMNRMIQLHPDFGPKNPGTGVSSAADYAERMKQSQQWWQDMARQLRAIYAGPKYLPDRLSETYCLPENSPRPGVVCVRIAGPAGSRDKCLWLQLSHWSDGWRVKNAGLADSKTSLKKLLTDLSAEAHRASTQPATKSSARPKAVGPRITIAPRQKTVASIKDLRVLYRGLNLPIAVGRSGKWEIRTADQRTIATVPVRLTITTEPVEGVRNIRSGFRGLDKDELKLIGQLPDGEYRLAWKVGDKRLSNVMRFRIKKGYTPRDEPLLSLAEIESVPGELPLLLVRAYRHKQQDPAPRAMEVAYATLNVDGKDLFDNGRNWSGTNEPLKVGGCYAYLLNLRYYTESQGTSGSIKLGKKHVVFAKAGPEEEVRGMPPRRRAVRRDRRSAEDRVTVQSAPITLKYDRSLGLQWDRATRNYAEAEPTTQPAVSGGDIERLIEQLAGETSDRRRAAQQALVEIGLPAAAALRAACKDNNAERAQRANVALKLIEEAEAGEAMRQTVGQMSALSRGWAGPAADPAEIGRQIKRLGSETFAERNEAQQALVKIGLPAAEALLAATKDASRERAGRAKDALDQLALRKEDWPISWGGMTCSFRLLSTDPTKCMALTLDENRRALLIKWSPADKSLVRTEATLSQKDADVLHRSLGRLELWRLSAAPAWPVDDGGRQVLTVTVGGRFVRLALPLQIRNLPRTQETAQLIGGLMGVDAAVQHLTAVIQKDAAIREQAAKAGKAAPGHVPPAPGADEALTAAELIAKAARLGQPAPTGELNGKARITAIRARDAADLAMHKYKGTYGVSGHRFPPRKADPDTPDGRKAFAEVERLYREAIDKSGLTDIGVYTRLRLSGAYKYHGQRAEADAMKIESEQLQPVVAKLKEKNRLRNEGDDWPALAAVIRVLRRPGDVSRDEIAGALTKLTGREDEAIGRLMEQFWPKSDYSYRWRTIKAMGLLNSPRSRKALLDLALGTNKDSRPWIHGAAREYVEALTDKSEARLLLVSADTAVLQQAAVGLKGVAVDKDIIGRLVELMKSPDRHLRLLVVYVFANDPGGLYTSRKVAAVVQGIPDIATMDKADGVAWPSNYTNAESHYRTYINALTTMVNAAKPIQDQIALARAGGLTWRCLVLSRGLGGDAKVRPDVRKILADPKAGLFRAWACQAIGKIGTADDLPLLRQVAEKDPMQRERGGCMAPMNKDIVYPVRQAAQEALKKLQATPTTRPAKQP